MTMTAAFGHEDPFGILRRMTVAFVLVPGNHGDLGEVFAAGADTQPRPHTFKRDAYQVFGSVKCPGTAARGTELARFRHCASMASVGDPRTFAAPR